MNPFAGMAPANERRECPTCGLTWYERHGHECPEPYSYEQARQMVDVARAAGGIVVSPRQRASIRMGLERGPTSAHVERTRPPEDAA